MRKLIIILGVVLLSGTDALAANLNSVDEARQNKVEDCSFSSCSLTRVDSVKADSDNRRVVQEDRLNPVELRSLPLVVAQFAPPDRGNPDDRGNTSPGGTR